MNQYLNYVFHRRRTQYEDFQSIMASKCFWKNKYFDQLVMIYYLKKIIYYSMDNYITNTFNKWIEIFDTCIIQISWSKNNRDFFRFV